MPTRSSRASVLVIGELNVDLIAGGLVEPPRLGREVIASNFQMTLGSASAIFACGLARLGHPVTFVSRVGADSFGAFCLESLEQADISTRFIVQDGQTRTGVTVSLSTSSDRALVTCLGAIGEVSADDLPGDLFVAGGHLHLTSFFLQTRLRPKFPDILAAARRAGMTTSFDPNADPSNEWADDVWEVLANVDIAFFNELEARQLTRSGTVRAALDRLGRTVPCAVIKRGVDGAIASRAGEIVTSEAFEVEAVDTTGAGDSFAAGFVHGFLDGRSLVECLDLGNGCGALSTRGLGGTACQADAAVLSEFVKRARRVSARRDATTDTDLFQQMVAATADVALPLSEFAPASMLVTPAHEVTRPRFPAIDYHNHLDALDPADVLRIMDECGIERIVNITMRTGTEAFDIAARFRRAAPDRFTTMAWMDWHDLHVPGFFERTVERLDAWVERGACGMKIWKDLGLSVRDERGALLTVDDERLAPLFDRAGELGVPVMFHTSDPDAFFRPLDRFNERYEELAAHPEWCVHGAGFGKNDLLAQRDRVFARHPRTTFVAAHLAERGEDLAYVQRLLDAHPNLCIDISARTAELGRQPYRARQFLIDYAERILFGTDLVPERDMYRLHFRFLETADEYFDYPSHASRQGRWRVYGLHLPDDVLLKIYRENALRLLGASK